MDLFPEEESYCGYSVSLRVRWVKLGLLAEFVTPEKVFRQILETHGNHRAVAG